MYPLEKKQENLLLKFQGPFCSRETLPFREILEITGRNANDSKLMPSVIAVFQYHRVITAKLRQFRTYRHQTDFAMRKIRETKVKNRFTT